ncbi:MAG: hypothetical protein HETSPECPRED_008452 [Heterodermia speciosa]|uniref:Carrier domain-containing protein n=1 Tax=Heterodermia speciosa TaxID=116794 RepID=A0A8H3FXS3_9LECA|nr:MAG: hypothetical protein HETSPECPRED_008452 [Heterodermia speciosa]
MASAKALRAVWSHALDIDEEEIEDSSHYADFGGDSVTALKLVEIAPSYGIGLDVETIFTEPTFSRMLAKTKQRIDRDVKGGNNSSACANSDLIERCAKTCGLSVDQIDDVFCEPSLTTKFFLEHQESGAWLSQVVFELSSDLDVTTACRAFEAIHARNHAFRSRFVAVNEQVHNVATRLPVTWQHAVSLDEYKASDLVTKVLPGQPAVRYGLVQESEKTYIIWTALHSVHDAWTRKLLCDDLEAFLENQDEFLAQPSRPTYKSHLDRVKQMDIETSKTLWKDYLAGLGQQKLPTNALAQSEQPALNKMIRKHIPKQRSQDSDIRLSSVAHAALGIILGRLTHCRDIAYFSIRGLRTLFPGAEAVMGAMLTNVPVRIQIRPTDTIRDLVAKVQADSISKMRHEPFGTETARKLQLKPQDGIMFNWHTRGMGLLSRKMGRTGEQYQKGYMKVVEEQATPYAISNILVVHDNRDRLTMELEYDDRIYSDEFMKALAEGFSEVLHQMCVCDSTTQMQSLLETVQSFGDGKQPGT